MPCVVCNSRGQVVTKWGYYGREGPGNEANVQSCSYLSRHLSEGTNVAFLLFLLRQT